MPHCILEYSENIVDDIDQKALLTRLNHTIAEKFKVDIRKIKSRAVERSAFVVSDGLSNQCLIHLEVGILDGREKSAQQALSKDLHEFLKQEFPKTLNELPCSLSVEVRIIDSELYVRENYGSI